MTDRAALIRRFDDMVTAGRRYTQKGLLKTPEALCDFLEGYLGGLREECEADDKWEEKHEKERHGKDS